MGLFISTGFYKELKKNKLFVSIISKNHKNITYHDSDGETKKGK